MCFVRRVPRRWWLQDGYILGLYRIPSGLPGTPGAGPATGKPVVHLQVWECSRERD